MVDHSLRFYVSPEALKNEDVMRQVESWPWVEVGQEGDKSFLQIGHNHLADLPQEFIPVGLPALFRKIGTGKVSLKSIYRKPHEGLKDGLYTVGTVKVSRVGFFFMTVGDNYLAVIRAFKMAISGRMNLVIDQSDVILHKQIGKLQVANDQLRRDNKKLNGAQETAEQIRGRLMDEIETLKQERDEYSSERNQFINRHRMGWWDRFWTPKPSVFHKFKLV